VRAEQDHRRVRTEHTKVEKRCQGQRWSGLGCHVDVDIPAKRGNALDPDRRETNLCGAHAGNRAEERGRIVRGSALEPLTQLIEVETGDERSL